MFGLHAALGRLFNESDDKHGGGPEGYAAVLSYNYWRSHLGGDPGVIGRVLDLQDKKAIIVGVLQPGFDSVTVDLQHGMIGFDAAVAMLQAIASTPAVPLARVSRNEPALVMQLLDAGAYGIICPMISTVAEAELFVSACRYPPRGQRSFGPARGLLYGGPDYFDHADGEILTLAMLETAEIVVVNKSDIARAHTAKSEIARQLEQAGRGQTLVATVAARHGDDGVARLLKLLRLDCGAAVSAARAGGTPAPQKERAR